MDLSFVTDENVAFEFSSGYDLLRSHLRRRIWDPWQVVNDEWGMIEAVDARMQNMFEQRIPGLVYNPTSAHVLTVRLLMAFEDFVRFANPDSPDTLAHQAEIRGRQWDARYDQLSDDGDG